MITSFELIASWVKARLHDEDGAALVEYALLVALIAIVCILAVTFLGTSTSTNFSNMGSAFTN